MGVELAGKWPVTATDRAVRAWIEKKGIDPDGLLGYDIHTRVNDIRTIKLEMRFDEDEEE